MTKSSMPRAAPHSCSQSAAQLASFSQNTMALESDAPSSAPRIRPGGRTQIRRVDQSSVAAHHAGQPDTDRHLGRIETLTRAQLVDQCGDDVRRRSADVVTVEVGRGRLLLGQYSAIAGDDQRQGFGPANVNANRDVDHRDRSACAFSSRSAWV